MDKKRSVFVAYATEYAALGLPVFPVKMKTKDKPLIKEWPNKATTDPIIIEKWWTTNPLANIAMVMGNGTVDIETDFHDTGSNGEESLLAYFESYGEKIPLTWAYRSGGGGIHRLFNSAELISTGTKILPGVDVRGSGGYAIVPPSVHPNGNFYEWVEGQNPTALPDGPATLPQILIDLLTNIKKPAPMVSDVPEKISDGERDDTLFRLASSLRAKGLTHGEIMAAMKVANAERCVPPVDDSQLEKICKQAAKYERGAKISKVPKPSVFSVADLQKKNLPPIRWIVSKILPQGLALLVSPPKYGKSWWVLDLCLSVAAGDKFLGFATEKGGCLYLALEDSEHRLQERANRLTYNAPAPEGFDAMLTAQTLDNGLIEQLNMYFQAHPDTAIIVIDTLQKVKGVTGKNEGAYESDYRQISELKRFADQRGICVLLVHHMRKGKSDGDVFERISGTNGIFGSADTAMTLSRANRNDQETILSIIGRDVESADLIMTFNKGSCRWEIKGSVEEMEERRLASEYENDPVVITVKKMLTDEPIYRATATELFDACMETTGVPPDPTPAALGKRIRVIAKMLWLRDEIFYFPPGKNGGGSGRKHTFQKKKK